LGEDEAFLNADEMEKLFKKVTESTKRAKLLEDSACKMLRAWWNWLYWGFGGDGPLPTTLSPTRYAWDGEGRRETVDTCKKNVYFQNRWISIMATTRRTRFCAMRRDGASGCAGRLNCSTAYCLGRRPRIQSQRSHVSLCPSRKFGGGVK
jgi:hypothetical protein